MKTQLFIQSLKVLPFAAILWSGPTAQAKDFARPSPRPRIEVCFVFDTTGSMGGLIEGAKQKIWSIANTMIAAKPTPDLKVGLVAYRDHGDAYVTTSTALTNDMDRVYAKLQTFQAQGGGDEPEAVNEALAVAVQQMQWSPDREVLKLIFLVGDAPPHMDYTNDIKYPELCQSAVKRGLVINTLQCGNIAATTPYWQEISKLSEGQFAAIPQTGNMASVATPMDDQLARLNETLNHTIIPYGSAAEQSLVHAKVATACAAPAPVAADRLNYNLISGKTVQGGGELLDAINDGSLKLKDVKQDELPETYRHLSGAELEKTVQAKQAERSALQTKIQKLLQEREAFLNSSRLTNGATDSFDAQVAEMVHSEAARKGIHF